ncbi:hypothetical protein BaRGS_00022433, partial [Batillaria attramentaria]
MPVTRAPDLVLQARLTGSSCPQLNYFCKSSIDIGPEADGTEEGKRRNEDDWCLTVALPARP